MNEIIQKLEANVTNGEENFCYISENKLNALKELSKREYEELKKKDEVIEKAIQELKQGITFCKNDSQGVYEKCNIAINREKQILQILEDKEV